ncbi:uncharacterized protein MONBRDRAFT_689, partial [Monosiga brevicollis MX1]
PSDILYCVKWIGWSHLENFWNTEEELRQLDIAGIRKLDNYIKQMHDINRRLSVMDNAMQEDYNIKRDEDLQIKARYKVVERVVDSKQGEQGTEYFCKWENLGYDQCTWELSSVVSVLYQQEIEDFIRRRNSQTLPNGRRPVREKFRRITEQPDWLRGTSLHLRDYQVDGVNWLAQAWHRETSVILADEMGLGKTIQSSTYLAYLFHSQLQYGPFLVVVPLSTMHAWVKELRRWAPQMEVVAYHGNRHNREQARVLEFDRKEGLQFNVLLTTFETVVSDVDVLSKYRWTSLLVDEAHRLKNEESALHVSLKQLQHDHRILITGTPLQNSMKELWALLSFIMPQAFPTWEVSLQDDLKREHSLGDHTRLKRLHDDLKPYLLRRVKKDVEKSLPAKVERILRVDLSSRQQQYYKTILTRNYTELRDIKKSKSSNLLNIVMELKKCCNHTNLIDDGLDNQGGPDPLTRLLRGSGKLILLDKLLTRLKESGHRVLIFSQMVVMLDVLAYYLALRQYQYQRLDGNTKHEQRKRAINHFNAEGSTDFAFLLSTRAGGLGVNLATADTVIIYDSDWNPQNDLQAQARAHRIGQTKQVNIYRLVSKSTVEEDILQRAKQKMVLDHLVIQRMDTTGSSLLPSQSAKSNRPTYSANELDAIMKFGAAELFKTGAGEEADNNLEALDLDAVLNNAETHDTDKAGNQNSELLSAFNTVDIATNEEELGQGDSWDDIIPEEERRRIEQEEEQARIQAMYLAPRNR